MMTEQQQREASNLEKLLFKDLSELHHLSLYTY